MNLSKLFEMQKELDDHIIKEKHLEGQDLLPNTILALQVELGELANEWRGFKHWSNDQEPRREPKLCPRCVGTGEVRYYTNETCTKCGGSGIVSKDPLIEEYVDCLHFILSIGLSARFDELDIDNYLPLKQDSLIQQFNSVFREISDFLILPTSYGYIQIFYSFVGLGEMLEFTWDEVEQAYCDKNAVNHQRQVNGY